MHDSKRVPMSVSEHALTDGIGRTAVEQFDSLREACSVLVALLTGSVRIVAFWVATLLPLSYLPLLAVGVAADHPLGFAGILAVNGVAFVLGHTHKRDDAGAQH
jgi:hypothetical protein